MTKIQVIIGFDQETMVKVNKKLYAGGIKWYSGNVDPNYRKNDMTRYVNRFNRKRICSNKSINLIPIDSKMIFEQIFLDSKNTEGEYEYISAIRFLTCPEIINGWEREKTYKISIEGKDIELSKESFLNIKRVIGDIE